ALWRADSGASADLVAAEPADGDRLATAPPEVTLTFPGPVDPDRIQVEVVGPAGPVGLGEPDVRGDTVRQRVRDDTTGRVRVVYHAVLRDGRLVSGGQEFHVGVADGPAEPEPTQAGYRYGGLASLAVLLIMVVGVTVLVVASRPQRR